MNNEMLLAVLNDKKIQIGVVDGKLKVLDPEGALDAALMAQLRDNKQQLIELLSARNHLTPSDFPYAALSAQDLEQVLQQHRDLDDIYVATPLQAGMLFHAQDDAGASYAILHSCNLVGALDADAFASAWRSMVARYAVFRTSFHVDSAARAHQLVHKQASLDITMLDWRGRDGAHLAQDLAEYRDADRLRGFDFSGAPLMRISLIRTADAVHNFVWLMHHSITDGWSQPLIFVEVLDHYAALLRKETPPQRPVVPYKHYIAWLQRQDTSRALAFWKRYLGGIHQKTALHLDTLPMAGNPQGASSLVRVLDQDLCAALRQLSQRMSCSMNTILQAAWGVLLQRYSGERDIVFGTSVSGRPPELEGVEHIIGMFLSTLPMRMTFEPDTTLGEALGQVQQAFLDGNDYSYLGLGDIQRCAELPFGERLFDTLVVYQNFPGALHSADAGAAVGLKLEQSAGVEQTNYTLLLNVFDSDEIMLKISYRQERFARATINRLVDQQAYMLAASDVFYASALIFLLLIPLVFLTKHSKGGAGSSDAAAGAH